jgi:hypothetical protein
MILIIPAMMDAYVSMLNNSELGSQLSTGLVVLDGPSAMDASKFGIAVGAAVEDPSGEFALESADVSDNQRQRYTLRCIAWARSGETIWVNTRNKCADILRIADATLAADRTMRGVVSYARVVGGTFSQQMGDTGIIVTSEFRIDAVRF